MKTINVIFFIILISTFLHERNILSNKDNQIKKLETQNAIVNQKLFNREQSLELNFRLNTLKYLNELRIRNGILIYYPKKACYICLEKSLLQIEKYQKLKKNTIIYCDTSNYKSIVSFNDAYGTNYKYTIGKPLFKHTFQSILLMKINSNIITAVMLIDQHNQDYLKKILEQI